MSAPEAIARRAFPDPGSPDRLSREVVRGLTRARRSAGLAVDELDAALETAWADLAGLRSPDEDFDRFSALSTNYSLENASKLFDRASGHCLEVWIALAQLRDLAEFRLRPGRRG